jgi:ATP-dependent RNA helicase DDX46/PRP5
MEALARKVLKDPIEITVGGRSIVGKDIAQHVIVLDEEQKVLILMIFFKYFYYS